MMFLTKNLFGNMSIGIAVYRIVMGLAIMFHGIRKFEGGEQVLIDVGSAISNFGIHSDFFIWGLIAALTEVVGGFLVTIGLFTRLASFFIVCTLVVAITLQFDNGISQWLYPVEVGVGFLMLFIAGPGTWCMDGLISRKR